MSILDRTLRDLRERRLWPVALMLTAALVAVPVLLSKSVQPAASVGAPTPSSARASVASALPAVSLTNVPRQSRLNGQSRDPFAQQQAPAAANQTAATATGATTRTSTPSTATAPTTTSTSTLGGTGGTSGTGGQAPVGTGSGPTTPKFPTVPSRPVPPALKATESFHVTLAITNAVGGLDTIDSLRRLSGIPSDRLPLLIELGVLKGGHRVLFLVQPGTVPSGPGVCSPGPIDCQILSLAQDQIETLSTLSATGPVQAAQFAVTAIKAQDAGSVAAANKARRSESPVGRRLLAESTSSALSLFQYEPGLGIVVDLRNLTVGGN